jgi:ATP-binding cassette, subfamily F, member 3
LALLTLTDAVFDFGRETILGGVSLALRRDVRYALVGANGAGKTTLLEILAGELALQGGQRNLAGGVSLRYLRQTTRLGLPQQEELSLREAVRTLAFPQELALQEELAAVARSLAGAEEPDRQAQLVARQGRLLADFERLDGYTLEARLEAALHGVGLPLAVCETPIGKLSGGERRRAALAAVLLGRCDLLLLDEPTNHLDLASCEWLESFLQARPGTVLVVSHDRWFLDRIAERTLHLDRGRLTDDVGNYTTFLRVNTERRRQEDALWQRQQDHIRQTEAYIRKNIAGQKTKQAQSRIKQLARLERVDRPLSQTASFDFGLRPLRPSGSLVLGAEGLHKRFGARELLHGLDLQVLRGERLGIIGPNGCGKTTLLRLLAGTETPDAGRIVRGQNVDLGFYDQHLTTVNDHLTVLGELQALDPAAPLVELRTFLGAFGFGEDLVDRPVASLSGGERGRLALLRLIKSGYNTMLLDEPTNHLDIRSRESLEAALAEFPGTLVMVSHDRRFLDRLVTRLVVFADAEEATAPPRVYLGNYGDHEYRRAAMRETAASAAAAATARAPAAATDRDRSAKPAPAGGLSKNEQARRRAWIAEVEAEITRLEAEQAEALAAMSSPDCDNRRRLALADRCTAIAAELAAALANWERWSAELEAGEN